MLCVVDVPAPPAVPLLWLLLIALVAGAAPGFEVSGGIGELRFFRLRYTANAARRANTATPPTTGPAITPGLTLLEVDCAFTDTAEPVAWLKSAEDTLPPVDAACVTVTNEALPPTLVATTNAVVAGEFPAVDAADACSALVTRPP